MTDLVELAKQYTDLIVALLSLGGMLYALHRKLIQPFLRKIEAMAEVIELQLRPNGGGSLVDKVSRIPEIERRVAGLQHQVNENHRMAEEHWNALEAAVKK